MKKIIFGITVVVVSALSSCDKDCACTTSYSGTGSEGLTSVTETAEQFNKGSKCHEMNSETTATDGLTTTVTCVNQP